MILNLDANWFLDCDSTNIVLTERRVITAKAEGAKGSAPKPENIGKTRDVQHGFYGSITQAAQGYLNKGSASMEGMLTATQLIAAWNEAAARVEIACRGIPRTSEAAPEPVKLVGHKGPVSFSTGVLVADGNGGVITIPAAKGPEPLYNFPTA
jgi:photosystem II stability/assembly factor-like uncharacterized protein